MGQLPEKLSDFTHFHLHGRAPKARAEKGRAVKRQGQGQGGRRERWGGRGAPPGSSEHSACMAPLQMWHVRESSSFAPPHTMHAQLPQSHGVPAVGVSPASSKALALAPELRKVGKLQGRPRAR